MGVCSGPALGSLLVLPPTWAKLSVFLALAIKLLALLLTPLLRLLAPTAPVLGGLPLPLRFSPVATWSVVLMGAGEVPGGELEPSNLAEALSGEGDLLPVDLAADSGDVGSAFCEALDEPPNILLNSRPPWAEILRRLDPARLTIWGGRGELRELLNKRVEELEVGR